jgi:hypothetical protein
MRPAMKRSATSATPAVHGQWPMIEIGSSVADGALHHVDHRRVGRRCAVVGALENTRNSSSLLSVMMVARTSGFTVQYCQPARCARWSRKSVGA